LRIDYTGILLIALGFSFLEVVLDRGQQEDWFESHFIIWFLAAAIEALGPVLPAYLEFAYLLVYGVGPFVVAALYFARKRVRIEAVLTVYLTGTLLAYALFPYFPSVPPRVLFGAADAPHYSSVLRSFNLFLVNDYGIHSSVFPSAHVSSAFSAAWALILFVPEHKWMGRGMLIYALSVASGCAGGVRRELGGAGCGTGDES